jgi:hypothetical protein
MGSAIAPAAIARATPMGPDAGRRAASVRAIDPGRVAARAVQDRGAADNARAAAAASAAGSFETTIILATTHIGSA